MKKNISNENIILLKKDEIIVNRKINLDNKCFFNYIINYEKTRLIFKNHFLIILIIYYIFSFIINNLFY